MPAAVFVGVAIEGAGEKFCKIFWAIVQYFLRMVFLREKTFLRFKFYLASHW